MASARDVIFLWLANTIQGDAIMINEVGDDVYDTIAPQAVTPSKYVIIVPPIQFRNIMRMGARIIQSASDSWIIKMVGRNLASAELEVGANRLRALFHRGGVADNQPAPFPLSVQDGLIHECYERDILGYPENDSGIVYRHLGGLYFISASTN